MSFFSLDKLPIIELLIDSRLEERTSSKSFYEDIKFND